MSKRSLAARLVNDRLLTPPTGILYASVSLAGEQGFDLLQKAIELLLAAVNVTPLPTILWSIKYQQRPSSGSEVNSTGDHVLRFPSPSPDLAFDDAILDNVKEVWQHIVGKDADEFLKFQDREDYDDDDE